MPVAPPTVCSYPGCLRSAARGGRCERHPREPRRRERTEVDREYDRRRGSAKARGYDATWRRLRGAVLAAEPRCVRCLAAGRVRLATEVDHIVPLDQGGARLDPENLQPLCHSCHVQKTAEDRRRARSLRKAAPSAAFDADFENFRNSDP